jgi:hypothetical protein
MDVFSVVRRSRTTSVGLVTTWRERVEATWGGDLRRDTLQAVAPLIASALRGSTSLSEALTALGHRAGFDDHPLPEVADWVEQLAGLAPRRLRPALRGHNSAYRLARAWAAGALVRQPRLEEDMAYLELRLGEVYERCETLGLSAEREVALAVVAIHGLPGCDDTRRTVLDDAAAAAHRIFRSGESVVVLASGRVLVLAERQQTLPVRTRHLAQAIAADLDLDGVDVRHWIEPLPRDRTYLAEHLRQLAA